MMLEGVRVLDFGWVWAGAVPGQMLAFLGAEVIKVESRARIDFMRLGPPITGDKPDVEQQPMFHNVNRGKLSFSIDFRKPEGRQLVLDLVEHCDVAIENFSPGVLERAGLAYDDLTKRRRDLVMLSLSAGGQGGPLSDMRSYASTIAAYCGLDSLCGYPGEEPVGIQQSYPDPNASLYGAIAILSALMRRNRTGRGDHIDLSQLESGLASIGEALAHLDLFGDELRTLGNTPPDGELIHDVFRCAGADNWVAVTVEDELQLEALAGVVGGNPAEHLPGWCAGRRHVQAADELQAAGIAAAAVTTPEDRFVNPHFRARDLHIETEHPVIGWEVVYREPWLWLGRPGQSLLRAPLLGESNTYVVCELLGRSPRELERLIQEQIVY